MWAYEPPPSRRPRDMPPSSSRRYHGSLYDAQSYEAPPQASSSSGSHERSRRGSIPVYIDQQGGAPRHAASSSTSRHANVVASDDDWDRAAHMRGGNAPPAYGRAGASRHDVEARTSDHDRHFRDKRGTYDTGEAENLRRAKSHSPRRAAREDDYVTGAAATRRGRGQQYYDHQDPIQDYGRSRAATMPKNGGFEYGSSPPGITTGYAPPYAGQQQRGVSPRGIDERVGGKFAQRGREKPYYGGGYDIYPEREAPRRDRDRDRRSRNMDSERRGWDDAEYIPRSSRAAARGGRAPPQPPVDDYDADIYGRGKGGPSAPRYRQSVPPQSRSHYDGGNVGPDDDPYAPPPRRRATSVSQGGGYGGGRYGERVGPRERRYRSDDDEYEAPRSRGGGGGGGRYASDAAAGAAGGATRKREKSKSVGKQAGKLFMTHAFPMIKQEAVPLLTKAAQAYFEQRK